MAERRNHVLRGPAPIFSRQPCVGSGKGKANSSGPSAGCSPTPDLSRRQGASAEALVRGRHPEQGLIPPGDFIPSAEASGLAPTRLELEITEGVLLVDEQRTLATLNALRAAGVRISMDDFGTGYSSLSYLQRFPFDKIKVDQSFARQLPHDAESASIVRAILTTGSGLGMSTTVEWVETAEQFAFTAAEACDHVHGSFFSQPLPLGEFEWFLQLRAPSRRKADSQATSA